MCCGSGRALIQAAAQLRQGADGERATLIGIDLVDAFVAAPAVPGPTLVAAPVET
ncbi:hypothetical protein [Actinoplanes sp. NPDC049118]|uniref:hypothetical protein n=1 Tax=Actinoplanes sp. NPDC049118 TaxID=3155769 RepID=UPI0033E7BA60